MEIGKKIKELRTLKGLTQEELAEVLYVSRTAVSKWESGRGLPNIDSLKEISAYFSVSIDDLLSGEKLLSIAERENKANLQKICDLLFGILDVCSFLLRAGFSPNFYLYSITRFFLLFNMFCGQIS